MAPPNPLDLLNPLNIGERDRTQTGKNIAQDVTGDPNASLGQLANSATGGLLPSGVFSGQLWLRVAEVIIGGALIIVGIGAMIRKPAMAVAAPAVKAATKVIK